MKMNIVKFCNLPTYRSREKREKAFLVTFIIIGFIIGYICCLNNNLVLLILLMVIIIVPLLVFFNPFLFIQMSILVSSISLASITGWRGAVEFGGGVIRWTGLQWGVLLVAYLFYILSHRNSLKHFSKVKIYGFFVCYCLMSLFVFNFSFQGVINFLLFLYPVLFFVTVMNEVNNEERAKKLEKTLLFSSVFMLILSLFFAILGLRVNIFLPTSVSSPVRRLSLLKGSAGTALFLLPIFALSISRFYYERKYSIWLIFTVTIIVLTGLRIGLVALIAIMLYVTFRLKRRFSKILMIVIIFSSIYVMFKNNIFQELMFYHPVTSISDITISNIDTKGRAFLWPKYWPGILQKPILGHGAGQADILTKRVFGFLSNPHNSYIQLLYDYGIFGLTIYLFYFLQLISKLRRKETQVKDPYLRATYMAITIGIIGLIITMMTDNVVIYWYFNQSLFLLLALGYKYNEFRTKGQYGKTNI